MPCYQPSSLIPAHLSTQAPKSLIPSGQYNFTEMPPSQQCKILSERPIWGGWKGQGGGTVQCNFTEMPPSQACLGGMEV